MFRVRLLLILGALALAGGCSDGDSSTPTSPTPPPSATRIIGLSGNLAFGSVAVGTSAEATLTITNSGTAVLTVTNLTVSGGLSDLVTASWTSGTIAAGGSQSVRVRFVPRSAGSWSGTVTVNADHTSGSNTIPISATATGFGAEGLWDGTYVVERCDGTGSVQDLFCSANRGAFPVGSRLPVELLLEQNGNDVAGLVAFGDLLGQVSGTISSSGVLTLQGAAQLGTTTVTITSWNTPLSGDSMTGTFVFNVNDRSLPGVATVTARIASMTRYDIDAANVPSRLTRLRSRTR